MLHTGLIRKNRYTGNVDDILATTLEEWILAFDAGKSVGDTGMITLDYVLNANAPAAAIKTYIESTQTDTLTGTPDPADEAAALALPWIDKVSDGMGGWDWWFVKDPWIFTNITQVLRVTHDAPDVGTTFEAATSLLLNADIHWVLGDTGTTNMYLTTTYIPSPGAFQSPGATEEIFFGTNVSYTMIAIIEDTGSGNIYASPIIIEVTGT